STPPPVSRSTPRSATARPPAPTWQGPSRPSISACSPAGARPPRPAAAQQTLLDHDGGDPQTPGPAGHDGGDPQTPGPAGHDGGDPQTPGPAGADGSAGDAVPPPRYQTEGAAGMDLHAAVTKPLTLAPGQRALVPTGWAVAIPPGFEGQVRPRSGLALRHGVTVLNAPGPIDAAYRGELKVLLVNHGQ